MQQQTLPRYTIGNADSTPITSPPTSAGCVKLVVVFTAKVRDQLFAFEVPECVLQLHQLNEQVVLRVEARRVHRALEVERQPLLNAAHVGAAGQVEEQRDVEHDGRGENAVAAQEVDLQLHRVAEPADEIDVVPPFLVVAARRIVIDPHDVAQMGVEIRIELRLQDIVENGLLDLLFGFERFGFDENLAVAI